MALITSMRNWAEFDGDLLNLILPNLFGKDRLSFSLVCQHWNAVATNSPYRYSPCLMYYYRRTRTWTFYQYNSFYNTSFPELEKAELRCTKYGWLLMSRYDDTLFFFDPSNNRKVELPCKVDELFTSICFFNPPTSPECVVVGIKTLTCAELVEICTLRHGEDEWEYMEFPIEESMEFPREEFLVSLAAPALHSGLIYFLSMMGDVAILDIEQRSLDVRFNCLGLEIDNINIKEQYLVKVKGEEALYGVFIFDNEKEVHVYRLSSDMKWDLMEEGIGDKVFYLSYAASFGDKAPSKSMENTIYFPKFYGDVAVFYSLSDRNFHSLDGIYSEDNSDGLKRLDHAAWLMPMPVQEVITGLKRLDDAAWLMPMPAQGVLTKNFGPIIKCMLTNSISFLYQILNY